MAAPTLQEMLTEAAQAVKHGSAFHGGAPVPGGERFALVVASPQAVRVDGGYVLTVGIDRQQASVLFTELENFLLGGDKHFLAGDLTNTSGTK